MSPVLMTIFSHTHASAWLIMLALFVLSFIFAKSRKFKPQRITQMILRLFFVIMLGSGIGMLIGLSFPTIVIIKGILAITLITLMEIILARTARRAATGKFWIILIVVLGLILSIAYDVIG